MHFYLRGVWLGVDQRLDIKTQHLNNMCLQEIE